MRNSKVKSSKITKRELSHIFWRSFQMEFPWNYERQMNMTYVYAMIPTLEKLCQPEEEMTAALKRHLEFFNTTPHIITLILEVTAAMEGENKDDPKSNMTAIDSIKTSLMEPLAGLGDSFFWGALRLIVTGVGTSLAMRRDILGSILLILIFNISHILFHYLATGWGYRLRTGLLKKIQANGMVESLTLGASIIGLIVAGAVTVTMITINIPLEIDSGENAVTAQSIFDGVIPNTLCLEAFSIMLYLLKKEVKPLTILIGLASFGIFGSWMGIF